MHLKKNFLNLGNGLNTILFGEIPAGGKSINPKMERDGNWPQLDALLQSIKKRDQKKGTCTQIC